MNAEERERLTPEELLRRTIANVREALDHPGLYGSFITTEYEAWQIVLDALDAARAERDEWKRQYDYQVTERRNVEGTLTFSLKERDAAEAERDAARAEAARWLDKAVREREEADNARAEVARMRKALTRLVGPSVVFAGWTPCALESGNCFWCGASQHLDAPHAADCALEDARAALAATEPEGA